MEWIICGCKVEHLCEISVCAYTGMRLDWVYHNAHAALRGGYSGAQHSHSSGSWYRANGSGTRETRTGDEQCKKRKASTGRHYRVYSERAMISRRTSMPFPLSRRQVRFKQKVKQCQQPFSCLEHLLLGALASGARA